MADGTEEGKIFVGGLSWETNEDKLKKYFSDFGEIIECLIVRNPETGKSRGFGFVTFNDPLSVRKVLRVSNHQLDGRNIDPKECNSKSATTSRKDSKQHLNSSKIFLGGLPPNITETNLIEFFSKYGKVVEAIIMFDQEKKKSRGFGFLSFDNEDAINKVVAERYVTINGKQVEVKRAEPQFSKSNAPISNGMVSCSLRNVSPMPCMMMPWGMWQPFMPPMNGMPPGYSSNLWSAAMAAGPGWSPYGFLPNWNPASPYSHPAPQSSGPFVQTSSAAGQNVHTPSHNSTTNALPSQHPFMPPHINSINQNLPNGSTSGLPSSMIPSAINNTALGNCSDGPNFSQQPRPNSNITTIFPPYNTHGNGIVSGQLPGSWPPSSFGNGTLPAAAANNVTNPMMVAQPSTAVPNQSNSDNMSTSYNQSLQFHGSRLMSQSQGYHPYRRS
ncbi:Heterogeneous nuclear ribonucleoprotein 27C [Sarcoptes scabiei]|nr:Heterogeneous nuclear ribonucleoprotein 27C [Sarcoptes scabiei]